MGKANKKRKKPASPTCPVCGKPVHDHNTYVRLTITDGAGRQHAGRGHSGCVGAAKAYEKLSVG